MLHCQSIVTLFSFSFLLPQQLHAYLGNLLTCPPSDSVGFSAFQTKPNKTYLTYLPHPPDWPTNLPVPDYTYLIYLSEIALTPDPIYGNPTAYINSQSLKMHKLIQNPKYTYKIHCVKIHPDQFSRSIEISKENTFAHFDFLTPLGPICSCWIGPL